MTPERWKQIERVLDVVLDCDPAGWPALLDEVCAGDPGLRREVDALLQRVPAVERFLQMPAAEAAAGLVPEAPSGASPLSLDDQRLGPYHVRREIGRGGMGRVFLAERADGQFERQVALKLLHADLDTAHVQRRFRAERQILAQLQHPNVAQLLDGGVTAAGRPYLVMEHVEGRPITRYCDEERLSIRERLELFVTISEAVQYAHRNLIVHRDLKPANILVTEEGRVKLLDFGIAKLLDPDTPSVTLPRTRTGQRWMTPEYAAPEQIRGEAVTTATDVYQLGVVCYELLAGHRPFERDGGSLHDLEQAVLDEKPARPSTAVSRLTERTSGDGSSTVDSKQIGQARSTKPERLRRTLRGDLDTICLTALRKDPTRRYASAEAFVEDINRYLAGLPVQARRDTFGYRAKKFVRRHRGGVAATLLFVLVLVGFAGAMAVQADRIAQERDRAQVEAAKAEQMTKFMMGLFEASDPDEALGDTVTARELLARGIERAEALSDQPEVQAQMMSAIGSSYERLGRYERARSVLEQALALRQKTFGPEHEEVAQGLNDLGALLGKTGEYETAETYLQQAVAMRRLEPEDQDLAVSLNELARVLQAQGQYDQAEPLSREALTLRQKLLGKEHRETATSLNDLGVLLWNKGEHEAAETRLRQALATYRNLFGRKHPWITSTLGNLALVAMDKGDYRGADSLFHQALTLNRELLGEEHPTVATTMHNWANSLQKQARYQEADSLLRQALRIARSTLGETHPLVSHSLMSRAQIHLARRQPTEAEPLLREALDIRRAALGEESWLAADAKGWLGECLTALARYEEAEPLLIESYERFKERRGRQDRRTQETRERLVTLYEAWGKPEQAAEYRTP